MIEFLRTIEDTKSDCVDIDECDPDGQKCGTNAKCRNSQGSYQCYCNFGYEQKADNPDQCNDIGKFEITTLQFQYNFILKMLYKKLLLYITKYLHLLTDECQIDWKRSACENRGHGKEYRCQNLPGSFKCACRAGFVPNGFDNCVNINECLPSTWRPGTETCLPKCGDNLGPCPDHCEGGYCCKKDNASCPRAAREVLTSDFSQCAIQDNPCLSKLHTTCHDTYGSYECKCDSGYESNAFNGECMNIDECVAPVDPCLSKPHSTCSDTQGSYECKCDSGYESDAATGQCYDIDECELGTHACPENSDCSNLAGESNFITHRN